jgi:hypothetical protein
MGSMFLKAKTRKEVALEFGISEKTLGRWIKKSNLSIPSGLINPFHLDIIYETFGVPDIIKTA